MRNGLRFADSKHCFADDEKTALREYLVFEIVSVECLTKIRRAVKLLYDVIADTIGSIQVKMKAASLQLARTHTRFTLCARRDYKLTSLGAPRFASRGIIWMIYELSLARI